MIKKDSLVVFKNDSQFGTLRVKDTGIDIDTNINYCYVEPEEFKSVVREVKEDELIELTKDNIKLDLTLAQLKYLYEVMEEIRQKYNLDNTNNELFSICYYKIQNLNSEFLKDSQNIKVDLLEGLIKD